MVKVHRIDGGFDMYEGSFEELMDEILEEMRREEERTARKARTARKTCEARARKEEHRNKRETHNWAMAQWEI